MSKVFLETERIIKSPYDAQTFVNSLYGVMTNGLRRVDVFELGYNRLGPTYDCLHRSCLPFHAESVIDKLTNVHRYIAFNYRSLQTAEAMTSPVLANEIDYAIFTVFGKSKSRSDMILDATKVRRSKARKLHGGYMFLPYIYDRITFGQFGSQCVVVYCLQNGKNIIMTLDEKRVPINPGYTPFETFMVTLLGMAYLEQLRSYPKFEAGIRFGTIIREVESGTSARAKKPVKLHSTPRYFSTGL